MKTFNSTTFKSVTFFLLVILAVLDCTLVSAQSYQRKILVEHFGGFWNQPSEKIVGWLDSLTEKFPGSVIPLSYYVTPCIVGCDPDDPLTYHKTVNVDNRSYYYPFHVGGGEDTYVDGIYGFMPWALGWNSIIPPCSDSTILARTQVPSPLSISLQNTFNANYDSMHIHVEITSAVNFTGGTNAMLRVVALEQYIDFQEPIGYWNHNTLRVPRVVRDMTPDHIGVYVGNISAGSTVSYDFDWAITGVYDLNMLRSVAFVQDDQTTEVIQAGESPFVPIPVADCSARLSKNYYCPQNGTNVYPEIEIKNEGVFTIHNLTIDYGIYNGNMYSTNWSGSFLPNTSMILPLQFPLLPAGSNILELKVESDLPYDTRPFNNVLHFEPVAHQNTLQYMTFYIPGTTNYPLTEDFESGTYPPAGWNIETTGSEDAWEISQNGGYMTSANSILAPLGLMFKKHPWNERTALVTPVIDFTQATSPVLSFDIAYKCKDYGQIPPDYDTLNIWASSDCGESWQLIYRKDQSQITTVTPCSFTNLWTPSSASQWNTDTVSMLQLVGLPEVMLKFEAISGEGQSLYLDNINLADGVVTNIAGQHSNTPIIFPNPTSDLLHIDFAESINRNIRVFDLTGRVIFNSQSSQKEITIDCSMMAPGVYTIEIADSKSNIIREQLIVKQEF